MPRPSLAGSPAAASTSTANLRRLIAIRFIVIAGQLLAVLVALFGLELQLHYPALLAVIASLAAINLAAILRLRWPHPVSDREYAAQLVVDILWLTLALYLSGGAANPFVSYYLVPLSISAAVLPWRYTWVIAGLSLAAYSLMLFYHHPLPALAPRMPHGMTGGLSLHVLGMWGNFAISAALITYFVARMAGTVREQQAELNRHREDALRDEQIMAVATLAAGTAHELGTPLSTMRILLDEMLSEDAVDPGLADDLRLLQEQVDSCRRILRRLVSTAETHSHGQRETLPFDRFVERTLEHWQVIRPSASYQLQSLPGEAPLLAVDSTLEQAIINLLDNAADASDEPAAVTVDWDTHWVTLSIRDQGPGLPAEIRANPGAPFLSAKGKGRGLGLFLSHATVERYGGRLELADHPSGGTIARLVLPCSDTGEV